MFVEASAPMCGNKEANVTNIYIFKEFAMHFNILRSKCRGSPIYIMCTLPFKRFWDNTFFLMKLIPLFIKDVLN